MRLRLSLSAFFFALACATSRSPAENIAFEPADAYPLGSEPEPIACGDLNGDRITDIVISNTIANGASSDYSVSILLGSPSGVLVQAGPLGVGKRPEGVILAKIDGDDDLDIVTSNFTGDSVSVLLGRGDGTFESEIRTTVSGGPRFVDAADFNGDGDMDLATSNYYDSTVAILKGNGKGSFKVSKIVDVGDAPEMIRAAHINADEAVDLVTCNTKGDSVSVLLGDGTGSFNALPPIAVGDTPRAILARDMDGDGLDDLIVANHMSRSVWVLQNLGEAGFSTVASLSHSSGNVVLYRPVFLDLADLNGDGREDLLVTWASSAKFSIFQRGAGAFEFPETHVIETGGTPVGIAAGDFDGDGDQDVVVSSVDLNQALVYRSYRSDPGIIVDNGDPGTFAEGSWATSSASFPFGLDSLFSKDGSSTYRWEAPLAVSGRYEVLLWWTVGPSRASDVPVQVLHSQGTETVTVDQTRGYGVWNSLGTYRFTSGKGTVIVSAASSSKSTCADAVRFRLVETDHDVEPALVNAACAPRPQSIDLGDNQTLAFQGKIAVTEGSGIQEWTKATFLPVGTGEESTRVAEVRLYVDANGNGAFDAADRQLGTTGSFLDEAAPLSFEGFKENIAVQESKDFFVVVKTTPPTLARTSVAPVSAASTPGGSAADAAARPAQALLACAAGLGLVVLFRRQRRELLRLGLLVAILLTLALLPVAGCGGGGGSDPTGTPVVNPPPPPPPPPPAPLQIRLSEIVIKQAGADVSATIEGLPLTGWEF